jgi:hypothetical protein
LQALFVGHDKCDVDSYKYLGIWPDEHLTFDKSTKELADSESRALGAVYGKFISSGGLTQEIRCLLTHENQPISPRVEMFEVFFPTDEKYLQALF